MKQKMKIRDFVKILPPHMQIEVISLRHYRETGKDDAEDIRLEYPDERVYSVRQDRDGIAILTR